MHESPSRGAGGLLAAFLFLQATPLACAPPDPTDWNRTLDFVDEQIRAIHPDPWRRTPERDFRAGLEGLRRGAPGLGEEERVVRLMQTVALLRDGHTQLSPFRSPAFRKWFPLRLDAFADGVFVTIADSARAELIGARVLRIGALAADDACRRLGSVMSLDHDHALPRLLPGYAANAGVLRGLGIIGAGDSLALRVTLPGGATRSVVLAAVEWNGFAAWPSGDCPVPGRLRSADALRGDPARLPLHVRRRQGAIVNYWFERIPEKRALYLQFNSVSDADDETLERFSRRLWEHYEQHADSIDRIVLDLRYNEGGNGYILTPFVQGFIRHPAATRRGALYALIGPGTYSAAVNCLAQLIKSTGIITVGEPTAGPLNWCSDTNVMRIPSSDLRLIVSRYCWQGGNAWDRRGFCPPEVPAPVTAADHFAGRDPALESALSDSATTLPDVLRARGATAMVAEYEKRRRTWPGCDWLFPYTEFELRDVVYNDLVPAGRLDDALAATRFNLTFHPKSSDLWSDLAEITAEKGDQRQALGHFEKALEFNPHRAYLQGQRDRLRQELEKAGK